MTPIIFINCSRFPFVDQIIASQKVYETRSRNTLRSLVGKRVLIAETGSGRPLVRCSARIEKAFSLDNATAWNMFRPYTKVPENSPYDWKTDTKIKWLYELSDVCPVPFPFHPAEGERHGRVWMEYNGKVVD